MTHQNQPASFCRRFYGLGQRVQPSRKHEHTIGTVEGPTLQISKFEVRLLTCAVTLQRYEGKGEAVARKEIQNLYQQALDSGCRRRSPPHALK